jgi:deazaflavin-dependent oxidoreductase (nitroreductase family)
MEDNKLSFNTKNGTRGSHQPGRILGLFNKLTINRIRKGGKTMGMNTLVLTTVGRKTGIERTTPVGWFDGGENQWLIVASAGGAPKNPAWYYNIAANPDKLQIEVGGRKLAVTAEQLHGAERSEAWKKIIAIAPRFAIYQEKTDRKLPVIRLTSRSG